MGIITSNDSLKPRIFLNYNLATHVLTLVDRLSRGHTKMDVYEGVIMKGVVSFLLCLKTKPSVQNLFKKA